MSTAEQKKAARDAAKTVKAAGGDQAAQDAAAAAAGGAGATNDAGTAGTGANTEAGAGGLGAATSAGTTSTVDPAVAAAAEAAGLHTEDLSQDDIEELRAAVADDAARAQQITQVHGRTLVREQNGRTDTTAVSLLLEVCDIYGVDPSADKKPKELLAWRFYPGSDDPGQLAPDAVVIVTGGGLKLRHYDDPDVPMDADTLDRLLRVFHLVKQDPKTKAITVAPLPDDLTLPASAVTGQGTTDHQYAGGYLQSGGRKAAADKERRRVERAKRLGLA